MTVGLGTGSTVAHLLPAIARARPEGDPLRRHLGRHRGAGARARHPGRGLRPRSSRLDIAIDGTDQVTPDGWLIKGGGGAHLREKIVAAAADRFVVISDSSKPVEALTGPVPLELFAFGIESTLARLGEAVELREAPRSPDDGVIADYERRGRRPGRALGPARRRPRRRRPRPLPGEHGERCADRQGRHGGEESSGRCSDFSELTSRDSRRRVAHAGRPAPRREAQVGPGDPDRRQPPRSRCRRDRAPADWILITMVAPHDPCVRSK